MIPQPRGQTLHFGDLAPTRRQKNFQGRGWGQRKKQDWKYFSVSCMKINVGHCLPLPTPMSQIPI